MSTNYYLRTDDDVSGGEEGVHLGKFVQGEPFHFRAYPDRGVSDYQAWRDLAASGQIYTEYGTPVTVEYLEDVVDDARRQWGRYRRTMPYRDQFDDVNGNRFTTVEFC